MKYGERLILMCNMSFNVNFLHIFSTIWITAQCPHGGHDFFSQFYTFILCSEILYCWLLTLLNKTFIVSVVQCVLVMFFVRFLVLLYAFFFSYKIYIYISTECLIENIIVSESILRVNVLSLLYAFPCDDFIENNYL